MRKNPNSELFVVPIALLSIFTPAFIGAGKSPIADIFLFFAVIALILSLTFSKSKPYIDREIVILVILSMVPYIISSFFSASPFDSVRESYRYILKITLAFLAGSVLVNHRGIYRKLYMLVASIFSIGSLVFIIFKLSSLHDLNYFSITYGHNRLAEFLLPLMPLAVFSPINIFLTGAMLLGFIFSFSRSAMILLVIYLGSKLNRRLVILLVLVGSIIMGANNDLISRPFYLDQRFEFIKHSLIADGWRTMVGFGPGNYSYSPQNSLSYSRSTSYAHNTFFHDYFELGFIGLFLKYLLILVLLIRFDRTTKEQRLLFTGILLSLFHAQIDFDWQIPSLFLLITTTLFISQKEPRHPMHLTKAKLLLVLLGILLPLVFVFNPRVSRSLDWGSANTDTMRIQSLLYQNRPKEAYEKLMLLDKQPIQIPYNESVFKKLLQAHRSGGLTDIEAANLIHILLLATYPQDLFWIKDKDLRSEVLTSVSKIIQSNDSDIPIEQMTEIRYVKFTETIVRGKYDLKTYKKYLDSNRYPILYRAVLSINSKDLKLLQLSKKEIELYLSQKEMKPEVYKHLLSQIDKTIGN